MVPHLPLRKAAITLAALSCAAGVTAQTETVNFEILPYANTTSEDWPKPINNISLVPLEAPLNAPGEGSQTVIIDVIRSGTITDKDDNELLLTTANYQSRNPSSEDYLENGKIALETSELPEDSTLGGAVGFIRMSSVPSTFQTVTSSNSPLANATGEIGYDDLTQDRLVDIELTLSTGETFADDSSLTVLNEDAVDIDPAIFEDQEVFESWPALQLDRDGQRYIADIQFAQEEDEETLAWQDFYFVFLLLDPLDDDGDGAPNFSDAALNFLPAYATMALGDDWYWVAWMDTFAWSLGLGWDFNFEIGWTYVGDGNADDLWLYTVAGNLGWLWTGIEIFPFFYSYNEGDFLLLQTDDDPETFWIYSFANDTWTEVIR